MSYEYSPDQPYCLFHEYGHWTKECEKARGKENHLQTV
jgi:hypothetical protein